MFILHVNFGDENLESQHHYSRGSYERSKVFGNCEENHEDIFNSDRIYSNDKMLRGFRPELGVVTRVLTPWIRHGEKSDAGVAFPGAGHIDDGL